MKPISITSNRKARLFRLPMLIFNLWCWFVLYWLITKIDPIIIRDIILPDQYLPLFFLVFINIFLTVWVITLQPFRSLIWGLSVSGFLYLRLLGIGHLLNLILITGLMLSLEIYWFRHRQTASSSG